MIHRYLHSASWAWLFVSFACHAQSVYPSISLTSDYRYNGVSLSGGDPAPQLSVYVMGPAQFHGGVWASKVDFDDPGDTSMEVDFYAGRTFELRDIELTVEALYTSFPDKSFPGPTYDFLQAKLGASRSLARSAIGVHIAWTPEASYGTGAAVRAAIDGAFRLRSWLEVSANVGRRWVHSGYDRTYWDAGATVEWHKLALDLRYVDTNLSKTFCGAAATCGAALVATLTVNLW